MRVINIRKLAGIYHMFATVLGNKVHAFQVYLRNDKENESARGFENDQVLIMRQIEAQGVGL